VWETNVYFFVKGFFMHADCFDNALANIKQVLGRSSSIMIIISDPVDPDCVAAALAVRWMLVRQQKKVMIVSRYRIPATMQDFPNIRLVQVCDTTLPDFSGFDALVLVDGATWSQFLGRDWEAVLAGLDLRRVINIDHHMPEDIQAAVPRTCLNMQLSSTVQVLYECFIKPEKMRMPVDIIDVLYRALLYDSRNFKNEMHPGEYEFAEMLIAQGADHLRAVDVNLDRNEVSFMVWAVEKTEFIADLFLSMLCLDNGRQQELETLLGAGWSEFNSLYKETILRQVKGFHYGLILQEQSADGSVRLSWRTRNYGSHLSVAEVARRAGFKAGGHRNAGGGSFQGSMVEARAGLLNEFRLALASR
jgi:nanoRNase/pAp phosphatase (c-di-AMP/oligoRNAs hydrolase)